MSTSFEFPDPAAEALEFDVEWTTDSLEKGTFRAPAGKLDATGTRVTLPARRLDCYAIESLGEHDAVDPLIKEDLRRGVPFRLVRIPCSIRGGPNVAVTRARVSALIEEDADSNAEIYSIYPTKLESDRESETEASIAPSLKIMDVIDIGGFEWCRRIKTKQPRSLITGLWSPKGADWILEPANPSEGLQGTWNLLFTLRWSGDARPLSIGVHVIVEATPSDRGFFQRLFLRSRRVRHRYGTWDPKACSDTL